MKYTKKSILEIEKELYSDEDKFDSWYSLVNDGNNTLNNIRDILHDYYLGEFDELNYPENLDLLCEFVIAGALELKPFDENDPIEKMMDYKTIIQDSFQGDKYVLDTCTKYFCDEFPWNDIWYNAFGDGKAHYLTLIKEIERTGSPAAYMMQRTLQINEGNTVLSMMPGMYPQSCVDSFENAYYASISDIDVSIARLYSMLCGDTDYPEHIAETDLFDDELRAKLHHDSFDRVLCNFQYGKTLKNLTSSEKEYINRLNETNIRLSYSNSADWLYASKLSDLISETGKAALIVSEGSLVNKKDLVFRKHLLDQHLIEAVVSLPTGRMVYKHFTDWKHRVRDTKTRTALVILSKNNETVRTIDLQSLYDIDESKYQCKNVTVSGSSLIDIDLLIEDLNKALHSDEDTEYSRTLTYEEMADTDYALSFVRYSAKYDLIAHGVPFGKVIRNIRRGVSLNEETLNTMKSSEPTGFYYLMGAEVSEVIDTCGLQMIKEPDSKLEKYCLKNGWIAITKNGTPKKSGVVDINENERILASDNCFVIELDTDQINPYYLAAYLNTDKGRLSLDRLSAGTSVRSIGVADLKEMLIPCPPLKTQKMIADKYSDNLKELELLRIRQAEILDRLTNIFFGED